MADVTPDDILRAKLSDHILGTEEESVTVGAFVYVAEVFDEDGDTYLVEYKSQRLPYWVARGMLDSAYSRFEPQPSWFYEEIEDGDYDE